MVTAHFFTHSVKTQDILELRKSIRYITCVSSKSANKKYKTKFLQKVINSVKPNKLAFDSSYMTKENEKAYKNRRCIK